VTDAFVSFINLLQLIISACIADVGRLLRRVNCGAIVRRGVRFAIERSWVRFTAVDRPHWMHNVHNAACSDYWSRRVVCRSVWLSICVMCLHCAKRFNGSRSCSGQRRLGAVSIPLRRGDEKWFDAAFAKLLWFLFLCHVKTTGKFFTFMHQTVSNLHCVREKVNHGQYWIKNV